MARNWTEALIGLWILLSPWLLGFSSISVMKWSNLIAGTVLILMSAWVIFGEEKSSTASQTANQK